MTRPALSALLVLCLVAAAPAAAQEAAYLVVGSTLPVPVVANGYVQNVADDGPGAALVNVATTVSPIGARGPYRGGLHHTSPAVPRGFLLPDGLQSALRYETDAWEAATRVLQWVADRVTLNIVELGPQDAGAVLRRGSGRCSGLANAAAALLMASGFEARTVSGLLVGDRGQAIPHRWIQCRLPGAQWVHSDPTIGLWAMTPRHIAFADAVVDPPAVRLLSSGESGLERLPRRGGWPMRPNEGCSLVCRLVGNRRPDGLMAVLSSRGGEVHRALLNPEARFVDLLPGSWDLELQAGDRVIDRRQLELTSGQAHSLALELPEV